MSVFKGFVFNVVINIIYRHKVDSLASFLLTFINLLACVCHSMWCSVVYGGWEEVLWCSVKAVNVRNGSQEGKGCFREVL